MSPCRSRATRAPRGGPSCSSTRAPAYTSLAQLRAEGAGPRSCGVLFEESADLPVDFRSIRFLAFDCATGAVG